MATYFILGNFNAQGIESLLREHPQAPADDDAQAGDAANELAVDDLVEQIATDTGVTLLGWWVTAGVHDAVLQIEAENIRLALTFALAVGATVGMSTQTLPAEKGFADVLTGAGGKAHTRHLGYYGHTRH